VELASSGNAGSTGTNQASTRATGIPTKRLCVPSVRPPRVSQSTRTAMAIAAMPNPIIARKDQKAT